MAHTRIKFLSCTLEELFLALQLIVAVITVGCGGYWAWHEYEGKKQQDRVKNSFEIATAFMVSNDYRSYSEKYIHIYDFPDKDSSKNLKQTSEAGVELDHEKRELLHHLIDTFESAVACVKLDHCDQNTIAVLMAMPASNTYATGYSMIKTMRIDDINPTYACELVTIRHWACLQSIDNSLKNSASWCVQGGKEKSPCDEGLEKL